MKYLMLVCTDPGHTPGQDDAVPDVDDWVSHGDGAASAGPSGPVPAAGTLWWRLHESSVR